MWHKTFIAISLNNLGKLCPPRFDVRAATILIWKI